APLGWASGVLPRHVEVVVGAVCDADDLALLDVIAAARRWTAARCRDSQDRRRIRKGAGRTAGFRRQLEPWNRLAIRRVAASLHGTGDLAAVLGFPRRARIVLAEIL